jgi:general secretion pathway protein G
MNAETADETRTRRKKWWQLWWVWAYVAMIPLLALIVMLSVLGIVAKHNSAIGGPAVALATAKAQMSNLNVALLSYRARAGNYPTQAQGLQALMTKPTTPPIPAKWSAMLDTLPRDPWGHPFVYRVPSTNPAMAYDLLSLGPDGVPSSDDMIVSAP